MVLKHTIAHASIRMQPEIQKIVVLLEYCPSEILICSVEPLLFIICHYRKVKYVFPSDL